MLLGAHPRTRLHDLHIQPLGLIPLAIVHIPIGEVRRTLVEIHVGINCSACGTLKSAELANQDASINYYAR